MCTGWVNAIIAIDFIVWALGSRKLETFLFTFRRCENDGPIERCSCRTWRP